MLCRKKIVRSHRKQKLLQLWVVTPHNYECKMHSIYVIDKKQLISGRRPSEIMKQPRTCHSHVKPMFCQPLFIVKKMVYCKGISITHFDKTLMMLPATEVLRIPGKKTKHHDAKSIFCLLKFEDN